MSGLFAAELPASPPPFKRVVHGDAVAMNAELSKLKRVGQDDGD